LIIFGTNVPEQGGNQTGTVWRTHSQISDCHQVHRIDHSVGF